MTRWIVAGLVLANALFFVWSQGYLAMYGFAPAVQSEPQRLQQQIHPEALVVLDAPSLKKAEAQAAEDAKPRECLVLGPYDDAQATALRAALQGSTVPADAWQFQSQTIPERWVVYIGKFANEQALQKKRAELGTLNVKSDPVSAPHLVPGLSLGRFDTEAEALQDLERLRKNGVRTARVLQEREASQSAQLKLPAATDSVRAQVLALGEVLAGKQPHRCD
ncbi:SPOR domain-containing protein [Curvibacter sp. APW13]|uniref:SPOR domain-containing protein n=1 Tax=Curvibacter sp. APW13 TaxID=3077236 RepID=UPI0028DFC165|nr:SPOR domain-containing protein [Curvibacter sp. APW13]MDT8990156.1 SPOR domain-containing protein [Curvibacter sp. APW13]